MKLLPFALLFAVAACQHLKPLGRDYGNAVNHNLSVHVINPAPNLEGKEIPDMEGTRAASAMERYDTGTVFAPETIETTSAIGD
jgi:hypothetical protein